MKTLETVLSVLSWIVLGVVLWALAPFLLKLLEMADRLHGLFQ